MTQTNYTIPTKVGSKPREMGEFTHPKFYDYLKVFLVIKKVGFSWEKELEISFNISTTIAKQAIKILEQEGYIISKDFWKIPADIAEIMRITNAGYFEKLKTYPKVYMITPNDEPQTWFNLHEQEIKKAFQNSESLRQTYELILNKKKTNQTLYKNFQYIENTYHERFRTAENGIIYLTKTQKAKQEEKQKEQLQKQTAQAMLELQKENFFNKPQLTNQTKNELTILTNPISNQIIEKKNSQLSPLSINGKKQNKTDHDKQLKEIQKQKRLDKKAQKEITEDEKIKETITETIKKNSHSDKKFYELTDPQQIPGLGKSITQLEKEAQKRFKFMEEILNGEHSLNKWKQDKKINELINILKTEKKLNIFTAQTTCKTEKKFKEFQENLKNLKVGFDGEDFILLD